MCHFKTRKQQTGYRYLSSGRSNSTSQLTNGCDALSDPLDRTVAAQKETTREVVKLANEMKSGLKEVVEAVGEGKELVFGKLR